MSKARLTKKRRFKRSSRSSLTNSTFSGLAVIVETGNLWNKEERCATGMKFEGLGVKKLLNVLGKTIRIN